MHSEEEAVRFCRWHGHLLGCDPKDNGESRVLHYDGIHTNESEAVLYYQRYSVRCDAVRRQYTNQAKVA